jgi:hypothetical protein
VGQDGYRAAWDALLIRRPGWQHARPVTARRVACQAMIGRHAYEESKRLAAEGDFYSLQMAAMRCADTGNTERLREAFPEVWDELNARYQAPGGVIEGDSDFEEYLRWRGQTLAAATTWR